MSTGPGSDARFAYETPDGTISLPSLATVPQTFDLLEAIADDNGLRAMVIMIRAVSSPGDMTIIRKLDEDALADLITKWGEWSGITLGESPAS